MRISFLRIIFVACSAIPGLAQEKIATRDSVIVRQIYRDTIIYKYDTVRIKRYIYSDTIWTSPNQIVTGTNRAKKGKSLNPLNWGIGPSVGAYYSPYNGFDLNIGFGIQYYLFTVPSFRNNHLGKKRHMR